MIRLFADVFADPFSDWIATAIPTSRTSPPARPAMRVEPGLGPEGLPRLDRLADESDSLSNIAAKHVPDGPGKM
jgi:hypothetical protein